MAVQLPQRLVKFIKVVFFIYVGLFTTIWLASAPVADHLVKQALQPLGLVLSEKSTIRYNPFTSHLEVNSLALSTATEPDKSVLKVAALDIEVRLYALFFKQLYISEFTLDGFYLLTAIEDELLTVSGIALPKGGDGDEKGIPENDVKKQPDSETPSVLASYTVVLPELAITNSVFDVHIAQSQQQFVLEQLVISALQATTTSQQLTLAVNSKINQAPLTIHSDISLQQGLGTIASKVQLSALAFSDFSRLLPEAITNLQGELSYQGAHLVELTDNKVLLTNENIETAIADFAITVDDKTVSVKQQLLTSDLVKVALATNHNTDTTEQNSHSTLSAQPMIKGDLSLQVTGMDVFGKQTSQKLAGFSLFDSGRIDIDTQADIGHFARWQQLSLENAFFSDDVDNDIPALASFNALTINQGEASANGLSIDNIELAGFNANAHINSDKVLLNLVDLGAHKTATEQEAESDSESSDSDADEEANELIEQDPHPEQYQQEPFYLALNHFNLADEALIHFLDESVVPHFNQKVQLTTLTAGPFDTRSPDIASNYQIIGTSNKYTKIDFSGEMKPFAPQPFYSVKGSFNEFELPPVSSYIKNALGYEIQSGQLDLALDARLTGNIIDGDSNILLRGIDLKAADKHETGNLSDSTAVPFNVALGMLKDSNGNVELDLPLDGDINSPQFGLSGFLTLLIKKATMMAAKDYLMTTFVPYANVVSIAIAAGKFALKVRINDLNYTPTQVALSDDQQVFLQQFAALLAEKQELQVKLCAVATPEDINKPLTTPLTDAQAIEQLRQLSTQRVELFKSQLVEQYGVNSKSLLSCTPQISIADDAKPHLSFKI